MDLKEETDEVREAGEPGGWTAMELSASPTLVAGAGIPVTTPRELVWVRNEVWGKSSPVAEDELWA